MSIKLTETELLQAIKDAHRASVTPEEGALTSRDISEAIGRSALTTRRILRSLIRSGQVRTLRVMRESIDGRYLPVAAYVLDSPPPAKRKR
jgi:predicted transcriptional regulator